MKKHATGFTLVELVLVIALLGVLSVVALPRIFGISLTSARANSMRAAVGSIHVGLSLYAANRVAQGLTATFPATLDGVTGVNAPGRLATELAPLFTNVLKKGITGHWLKLRSGTCYVFDNNGSATANAGDIYFRYTVATGRFLQVASCT